MLKEFKEFISKGSVLDLAVAVVIGKAFGDIITALVEKVIMPLIGMIIGGIDFTNLVLKVGDATLEYGVFIQAIVNFLIISFCIFLVVKAFNTAKDKLKKKEEVKEEKPVDSDEVKLLKEIRDLLKKKK